MRYIVLIVSFFLLSGCTTVPGYYEADPLFNQQSDLLSTDVDIVDTNKLQQRVTAVTDKALRNALVEDLLTISDRVCARHQSSIIAGLNTWNVATGTLTSLLTALGTVTGGETAKAALSASASFTNSTRSLVNEEVYAKALGTTIVKATMSARDKQLAKINTGMSQPLDQYSVQSALRDVYNYQNRCSFYFGLVEITKALEQRKRSKAEILERIVLLETERAKILNRKGKTDEIDEKLTSLALELENAPQ
ncbi:hypothetical protein KUL152_32500 [Tenacibaculum sp. KUL152]|nr:hypothetical protein KUL152_32500 [Tenacibaculum sp. KUL152]GFD94585.1 hypothetical protein KUL154_33180 [Alteromonas sp. KUL154]GFE03281.1 hypothetical protein KUL156_58730 [Alteromonas sp. KUL156]